jgi:uncharacterized protein
MTSHPKKLLYFAIAVSMGLAPFLGCKGPEKNAEQLFQEGRVLLKAAQTTADYAQALQKFQMAAQAGHTKASHNLGLMFLEGKAGERNTSEGLKWLTIAGEKGQVETQRYLGLALIHGKIVNQDVEQGLKWLNKAAEQGDPESQIKLGQIYSFGDHGIGIDPQKAFYWVKLAANQNHPASLNDLGILYENGIGTAKDMILAADCFRRSAEAGDAKGQSNYGRIYTTGDGVPKDPPLAYFWLTLSARQKEITAEKLLILFEQTMSPQDLAKGKELVGDFDRRASAQATDKP